MAKRTPAQIRKALSKPTKDLSASELDTRRETIAAGRVKTTKGKKKKKGRKATDVFDLPALLRKRRRKGATFE